MDRPVDPAALEVLAITLWAARWAPKAWELQEPEMRQTYRQRALELLKEQDHEFHQGRVNGKFEAAMRIRALSAALGEVVSSSDSAGDAPPQPSHTP